MNPELNSESNIATRNVAMSADAAAAAAAAAAASHSQGGASAQPANQGQRSLTTVP